MARKTSIAGAIVLLALTVIVATGAMSASAASNDPSTARRRDRRIVGRDPDIPGAAARARPGDVRRQRRHVENATAAPALRGASHGVWNGPREVRGHKSVLQVQPTNRHISGHAEGQCHRAGRKMAKRSRCLGLGVRDPAGNVILAGLRGTATGNRIHVDPIPISRSRSMKRAGRPARFADWVASAGRPADGARRPMRGWGQALGTGPGVAPGGSRLRRESGTSQRTSGGAPGFPPAHARA